MLSAFALLALAACSSPGNRSIDVISPTPVPTTFISGGVCPAAAADDTLPDDAGCVTSAGDLVVYARIDDEGKPRSWRTRVGEYDDRLRAGNDFSYPRAIAEVDIDEDGSPEWFIKTFDLASHGTNWQQLGLFVLNDRRLRQVTLDDELFAIRVGGISRMGEGARCEKGHLVLLRTEAEDRQNVHWSYSERAFQIVGTQARSVGVHRGRLRLTDYNDPKLDPYYALECHGVVYP
jgi:hypothetical protein